MFSMGLVAESGVSVFVRGDLKGNIIIEEGTYC